MRRVVCLILAVLFLFSGCGGSAGKTAKGSFEGPFLMTGEYEWCGESYAVEITYEGVGCAKIKFLSPSGVSGLTIKKEQDTITEEMLGIVKEQSAADVPESSTIKLLCQLFDAAASGTEHKKADDGTETFDCGDKGYIKVYMGVPEAVKLGKDGPLIRISGFQKLNTGE